MNAEQVNSGGDKLRDGPCAKPYLDLETCAFEKKKDVRSHRVSLDRNVRLIMTKVVEVEINVNCLSLQSLAYENVIATKYASYINTSSNNN